MCSLFYSSQDAEPISITGAYCTHKLEGRVFELERTTMRHHAAKLCIGRQLDVQIPLDLPGVSAQVLPLSIDVGHALVNFPPRSLCCCSDGLSKKTLDLKSASYFPVLLSVQQIPFKHRQHSTMFSSLVIQKFISYCWLDYPDCRMQDPEKLHGQKANVIRMKAALLEVCSALLSSPTVVCMHPEALCIIQEILPSFSRLLKTRMAHGCPRLQACPRSPSSVLPSPSSVLPSYSSIGRTMASAAGRKLRPCKDGPRRFAILTWQIDSDRHCAPLRIGAHESQLAKSASPRPTWASSQETFWSRFPLFPAGMSDGFRIPISGFKSGLLCKPK